VKTKIIVGGLGDLEKVKSEDFGVFRGVGKDLVVL